ncbi:MAG: hypothetical protein KGL53_15870 [Elusimicrobia bacterium]|nr:hypothetical protein [Elusimicrobiota bacterium]
MSGRTLTIRIRIGRRELLAGLALALVSLRPAPLATENLTLTTYYPSPYGVYQELRSTGNAYLAYQTGRVGVGTTSPAASLDVNGGARVRQDGEVDGRLGVGGAFVDVNNTGLSVTRKNIHVEGPGLSSWLRVGEAWGYGGVYSESGDLVLGSQSGWVRIGPDGGQQRLRLERTLDVENAACSSVPYGAGTTSCPGTTYATYTDGIKTAGVSVQSVPTIGGGTYANVMTQSSIVRTYDAASGYMRCCSL